MFLPPKDLDEFSFGTPWSPTVRTPLARHGVEYWFRWLGTSLTFLGPFAFLVSSEVGATALVPMFFGLSLIGLSLVSLHSKHSWRWNLLAGIATAFALGDGIRGLNQVFGLARGLDLSGIEAGVTQSIMAALCLVFLAPILARSTGPCSNSGC